MVVLVGLVAEMAGEGEMKEWPRNFTNACDFTLVVLLFSSLRHFCWHKKKQKKRKDGVLFLFCSEQMSTCCQG